MRDVALLGAAGSGKDSVARVLVAEYGFHRVAFADALKDALLQVDPLIGARRLSDHVSDGGWDVAKVNPEVRRLLQTFGMSIREFNEEFWIDRLVARIEELPPDARVVITDVRMPNEFEFCDIDLGALLVRLSRPGVDTGEGWRGHVSERALGDVEVDVEVDGDSWTPASAAHAIWVAACDDEELGVMCRGAGR